MARKKTSGGSGLKKLLLALIAAIAGLFIARKTVLAPAPQSEYRLPPVPDVPPAGPEEATPLTEEEQKTFLANRGEAEGESGDVTGAIDDLAESNDNGSADGARFGIAAEPAIKAAEEAEAARASGTEEGKKLADQLDKRMYFGGAPAPAQAEGSAPDTTSEGFDVSGADAEGNSGNAAADEDLTDVGLDVDADADSDADADEASSPDLTSEGLDTGGSTPAGAITSGIAETGDGYVKMTGDVHDCPEEYPIKGNANSRIYHMPGESSYDATIPELCFASEDVAAGMGFRARKR